MFETGAGTNMPMVIYHPFTLKIHDMQELVVFTRHPIIREKIYPMNMFDSGKTSCVRSLTDSAQITFGLILV